MATETIDLSVMDTATVVNLASIVRAVEHHAPVRYLSDITGMVLVGDVRHLVTSPEDYSFASGDIREAYLRITLATGFDIVLSVGEVVGMLRKATLAFGN